ncbi:L-arabinokinase-like [Gossypium australe]|uniref:L-arabinokinase-like n=1 Tax=Gossypium australe TaxID=47621 RepID=A0A5B6V094_9ROSI|nr:L-arabinokinase-like [Gossypium australe]
MLDCKPMETLMNPNVKLVPKQKTTIRILRHIKSAFGRGLLHEDKGNTYIVGYSNVGCVGFSSNKRFTSGYCISFLRMGGYNIMK